MKESILKRWSSAENYMGEDFSDYYVVSSFTRDSNVIEVANFIAIADFLMDIEDESEQGWKIARFGHWACGYLYCIFVHKDSPLVSLCEEIALSLREYPIFDDDVLAECEEIIRQAIIEDADEDEDVETLIHEAPASLICDAVLRNYW